MYEVKPPYGYGIKLEKEWLKLSRPGRVLFLFLLFLGDVKSLPWARVLKLVSSAVVLVWKAV